MEIGPLYNTRITLEDGDEIAFDVKEYLWIRCGDKLYKSTNPVKDKNEIPNELHVHSAGFYERHKDIDIGTNKKCQLISELEWIEYKK